MAHRVARRSTHAFIVAIALTILAPRLSTTRALEAEAQQAPAPLTILAAADTEPPTAPTDFHLVSRTKGNLITLGWTASTDNVGVASYSLFRDGCWLGTLTQAGTLYIGLVFYDRLGSRTKTAVTYDLYASDAAGNRSAPAYPSVVVAP